MKKEKKEKKVKGGESEKGGGGEGYEEREKGGKGEGKKGENGGGKITSQLLQSCSYSPHSDTPGAPRRSKLTPPFLL